MINTIPSEAKELNLTRTDYNLLLVVLAWYNGKTVEISGEEHQIGTQHEPALKDLCLGWDLEYDPAAHDRLLDAEWLTEERICRHEVDWVPTFAGLETMEEACQAHADLVEPRWARDRDRHSPVVGNEKESLLHRKGVATVAHSLKSNSGLHGAEQPIEMYPVRDEARMQNIYLRTPEEIDQWGVEVVTSADAITGLIDKWQGFTGVPGNTLWIFDTRATACELFNELHRREIFTLDGGLCANARGWNPTAINNELWRSENRDSSESASPAMQTITAMFEGDGTKIADVLREYNEY